MKIKQKITSTIIAFLFLSLSSVSFADPCSPAIHNGKDKVFVDVAHLDGWSENRVIQLEKSSTGNWVVTNLRSSPAASHTCIPNHYNPNTGILTLPFLFSYETDKTLKITLQKTVMSSGDYMSSQGGDFQAPIMAF